jgi:signal transduction histidine kinase
VEHTPSGGKITVTAQENALNTEIVISDTGNGISESDLPHIFERFYRSENFSKQGCGIGLALARKIITAQDGTVQAKNGRHGGAVFRICIYKSVV